MQRLTWLHGGAGRWPWPAALAPMHSAGLTDVIERPAERALLTGMRAYDDAQYPQAEARVADAPCTPA